MTEDGNIPAVPLPALTLKRLGLETQHEPVVFVHSGCSVARSEGFAARGPVELCAEGRSVLATLYFVWDRIIGIHEVGVSEVVWKRLAVPEGTEVCIRHPQPLESLSAVRSKVYGHRLDEDRLQEVIRDIAAERYSDVELAAFVAAFSAQTPDLAEMVGLTRAMVDVGDRLSWDGPVIADKHSVGGLPANRTTPVVVAIAASLGLTIPKTSSRAITSPAGTADTMETMTNVELDTDAMRRVVEREGGCLAWGGSVRLSPADDILIRVERALDLDSPAQLVASVLSKKLAAGSTHVLLDVPVGPTAKIRTNSEAAEISNWLAQVGAAIGLIVRPVLTDGRQPVGSRIGPALEARDVLAVLRNEPGLALDLRNRAIMLAGALLELAGAASDGTGQSQAEAALADGRAFAKFLAICEAQGGFREPGQAPIYRTIPAAFSGTVERIDNRVLARIAKLAGAPFAKTAGLELHTKLGEAVEKGQPLITVHSETPGGLDYALAYAAANPDLIGISAR